MPHYKTIATVTWEFDCQGSISDAMEKARKLTDCILLQSPQGDDYHSFGVQMELLPLRERTPTVSRLREYKPEQVFSWITDDDSKKTVQVDRKPYGVRMNSDRYKVFRRNPTCVACGLTGTKFILECQPGSNHAHFNFYAEEDGRLIMMTKDHIQAKAYGGADTLDNFQTLCTVCNGLKASYPLSPENVRKLRDMLRNPHKLPTRELRFRIQEARILMMDCLNGQ